MIRKTAIAVPTPAVAEFCRRWKIIELALFGSVMEDRFGPNSDVDVLVSFAPDSEWDLFDAMHMEEELSQIFGRPVDLVTRRAIEHSQNRIRREASSNPPSRFMSSDDAIMRAEELKSRWARVQHVNKARLRRRHAARY